MNPHRKYVLSKEEIEILEDYKDSLAHTRIRRKKHE